MGRDHGSPKRMRRKSKRSPVGASPGTLIADPEAQRTELNLTLVSPDNSRHIENATLKQVRAARGAWPIVWLDCVGLADVGLISEIGALFGLHPLALEDTVNTGQRPKVDFFDDHAFVVLGMIDGVAPGRFEQISVYFGADFVVTFQERKGDPFDPVRKRIEASSPNRLRTRKPDYLAYALIDEAGSLDQRAAAELVETQRDMLSGLIDMHLSMLQVRTNDVIGLLTIVSVIFIPLTFMAGVWGMNFDPDTSPWNMPELRAWFGYPAALAAMALVAVGMVLFFRWKKWL